MATFHSPKYKGLRVADIGVNFKDGVFETTDKKVIERLRELDKFGVTEAESKPVRRASSTSSAAAKKKAAVAAKEASEGQSSPDGENADEGSSDAPEGTDAKDDPVDGENADEAEVHPVAKPATKRRSRTS